MNRDILRSALSAGIVCAILLLLVELARVIMSIIGLIAMVKVMQDYPDMQSPWMMPPMLFGYALTAAGLVISIVLLVKLSSARRELDRQ